VKHKNVTFSVRFKLVRCQFSGEVGTLQLCEYNYTQGYEYQKL